MYYNQQWINVNGDQLHAYLEKLNPVIELGDIRRENAVIEWIDLPFYNRSTLLRVRDKTKQSGLDYTYYVTDGYRFISLDNSSPSIFSLSWDVSLTEENVLEYLRFICFFHCFEDLLIVDDPKNPYIPENTSSSVRQSIKNHPNPLVFKGLDHDEREYVYKCSALVLSEGKLKERIFSIGYSGYVETVEDKFI